MAKAPDCRGDRTADGQVIPKMCFRIVVVIDDTGGKNGNTLLTTVAKASRGRHFTAVAWLLRITVWPSVDSK
jgi:hypothetical protein